MYVTVTDIVGEKRIDLSYSIKNFHSSKEIAVVGLFSDNIQYEFTQNLELELNSRNTRMKAGT